MLRISAAEVGVAGLKDRRAVTRQYVSVPARCQSEIASLGTERIRVLEIRRHRNKLRTGHLQGNRFSVLLRGVQSEATARAHEIAHHIGRSGYPNYFGEQRYGREGEALALGWRLLSGAQTARDVPASRRKFLLRFALSSVQSALFDETLTERLTDGLIDRVVPGDVMQVVESGGMFVAEDVAREQERSDRHEITATGPMFGPKMIAPTGEAAMREALVLERHGVGPADFLRYPKLTSGTRRPFIVHPRELKIELEENGLRFRFILPSGVYATTLLREFMKDDSLSSNAFAAPIPPRTS
jgi:tRNA pseudouridine13 synthase